MNSETEKRNWWSDPASAFGLAFLFLILTAALGTFLRFLFVSPVSGANYKYFLHAHSHIGFLGWVYNALYALVLLYFVPRQKQKGLMRLFWFTQLATVGMLLFFPIQGYARESIIFSTLHIFFSWAFAGMAWKRLQSNSQTARRYLKLALFFMVISSLGPFAMGPLMINGMAGSSWYYMAIYYYLHFQYNGWFIFALLALLYQHLAQQGVDIHKPAANTALAGFTLGAILSLSLSILWAEKWTWLYIAAALGGMVQLVACFYCYRSLRPIRKSIWHDLTPLVKQLLLFAGLLFLLKNVLQLVAAFPSLSDLAFGQRNLIIAFLHLIFLGVVTPVLLAEGFRRKWLPLNLIARWMCYLYLIAFVLSELLLTLLYLPELSAVLTPYYATGMVLLSATMFASVAGIGLVKLVDKKKIR